ncbi:NAD(P)/FAD-dependent oxidoreductase [soil metagenome]
MKVAIVGAGPAGMTAASALASAGHDVTVFERTEAAGGRTRTVHFGEGHWLDTGAGWLTDFYPTTMGLLRHHGLDDALNPLVLRGGGDLLLDGVRHPSPNSIWRILASRLVNPVNKVRFFLWMALLIVRQRSNLRIDRRYDSVPAMDALRSMGSDALERIVRPSFEGPFFARLEQMNGTLVRSWLRSLSIGGFFQPDQGMDRPWRRLADTLDVRYSTEVARVGTDGAARTWIESGGETLEFDAVVLAVPAPVAARLLGESAPDALGSVPYVPHVRAYVARPTAGTVERTAVHIFPNDTVATVERGMGGQPAWGRVPVGWEWTLICAPSASSQHLIELDHDALLDRLFDTAAELTGERIEWREHEVVHLVRWSHAVPVVDVDYYHRLDSIPRSAPIALAGDWCDQPCVEGAVRSGYRAAALIDPGVTVPPDARR